MKVSAILMRKVMASRISPRAMAVSKLPIWVSITVAVVSTRVWWRILPPTIITAPTSEITLPNPAMTAARIESFTSLRQTQSACHCPAPRVSICR